MTVPECQGLSVSYAPIAGVTFSEKKNDKGPKQARKQGGRLMVTWTIWGRGERQTRVC